MTAIAILSALRAVSISNMAKQKVLSQLEGQPTLICKFRETITTSFDHFPDSL